MQIVRPSRRKAYREMTRWRVGIFEGGVRTRKLRPLLHPEPEIFTYAQHRSQVRR